MNTRAVIRKDAESIRQILIHVENLEGHVHADESKTTTGELEQVGAGYLAIALRLERIAQRFNDRGAAYLGI